MPDCQVMLVHNSGTMIGKVAHIYAASPKGPRYVSTMSDDERKNIDNLMVVCGLYHDVIDDKANEKKFPGPLLLKYKKQHEGRFKKAEQHLIEQFVDVTQLVRATYPKTLAGLAKAIDVPGMESCEDEINGVKTFVDRLNELPLSHREFALRVSERMRRRRLDKLPIEDVIEAFGIGRRALERYMNLLENHRLGNVGDFYEQGKWLVSVYDRHPGGNPFIEILDFCEVTGHHPNEFLQDLNFELYDDLDWPNSGSK